MKNIYCVAQKHTNRAPGNFLPLLTTPLQNFPLMKFMERTRIPSQKALAIAVNYHTVLWRTFLNSISQNSSLPFWIPVSLRKYSAITDKNCQQHSRAPVWPHGCCWDRFSPRMHFGEALFKPPWTWEWNSSNSKKTATINSNLLEDIPRIWGHSFLNP